MKARYSSLCPWCGHFIAKSRSHVAKLPEPILVQPHRWDIRLRRGWWTDGLRYDPRLDAQTRAWVHEHCHRSIEKESRADG